MPFNTGSQTIISRGVARNSESAMAVGSGPQCQTMWLQMGCLLGIGTADVNENLGCIGIEVYANNNPVG